VLDVSCHSIHPQAGQPDRLEWSTVIRKSNVEEDADSPIKTIREITPKVYDFHTTVTPPNHAILCPVNTRPLTGKCTCGEAERYADQVAAATRPGNEIPVVDVDDDVADISIGEHQRRSNPGHSYRKLKNVELKTHEDQWPTLAVGADSVKYMQHIFEIACLIRLNLGQGDQRMAMENTDSLLALIQTGKIPITLAKMKNLSQRIRQAILEQPTVRSSMDPSPFPQLDIKPDDLPTPPEGMYWRLIDDDAKHGNAQIVTAVDWPWIRAYYHDRSGWTDRNGVTLGFEPTHYAMPIEE
jgi:hypothetical protein